MIDLRAICNECQKELDKLKIPYVQPIAVTWDRAVRRWGCCHWHKRKDTCTYDITISSRLNNEKIPSNILKEVMMHELLHTSTKKHGHDTEWDMYAAKVNAAYGYKIQRLVRDDFYNIVDKITPVAYKYILTCQKCGAIWRRNKASKFVKECNHYTCQCGGKIKCQKTG